MNALITGGSSGIGFDISQKLNALGHDITIVSSNINKALKSSQLLGGCNFIVSDLSCNTCHIDIYRHIQSHYNHLDYLVLCAGYFVPGAIETVSEEEWDRSININLKANYFLIKSLLPLIINGVGKSIIVMNSILSQFGSENVSLYSSTKSGLFGMVKSLSVELAKYDIRINSISPSFIETPMVKDFVEDAFDKQKIIELHPLKRLGSAKDVSNLAIFLLGESSSWITGQDILLDGGRSSKV